MAREVRIVGALVALVTAALVGGLMMEAPDASAQGKPARAAKPARPGKGRKVAKAQAPKSTTPRQLERTKPFAACPPEMVNVRGLFCVDRYEAHNVEATSSQPLSPYYPPHPKLLSWVHSTWSLTLEQDRAIAFGNPPDAGAEGGAFTLASSQGGADAGPASADAAPWWMQADGGVRDAPLKAIMSLPELGTWQAPGTQFKPKAVSKGAVVPQGSMPGFVAVDACHAAGKRLRREAEWVMACKGEQGRKFPYGNEYKQGACNVFRADHPARILHGSASEGLSDPRLNLVKLENAALLRETGGSPLCASTWGKDAIYDMVGNVDEWVDEPGGMFLGGFYSRATRNGCESKITAHPPAYFDYSTGFRCCADLAGSRSWM